MSYRYYVDVLYRNDENGRTPLKIAYRGKWFTVEFVDEIRQTWCPAGGCGTRYTVRFGSTQRFLFKEGHCPRWFLQTDRYDPVLYEQSGQLSSAPVHLPYPNEEQKTPKKRSR